MGLDEDWILKEGVTCILLAFFWCFRASNSEVNNRIWPEFEARLRFYTVQLVTRKFDKGQIKNKGALYLPHFPNYNFQRSRASNSKVNSSIWPEIKLIRYFISVLIICKYEEDLIKMKALLCLQNFPHNINL